MISDSTKAALVENASDDYEAAFREGKRRELEQRLLFPRNGLKHVG